jgi:hypothetical protein
MGREVLFRPRRGVEKPPRAPNPDVGGALRESSSTARDDRPR